jgi:hypothetical protein
MRAALEATMLTDVPSVVLSAQFLPDRLDGGVLPISVVLLFFGLFMTLSAARWRVRRRLSLPGLKEVQAWERLANAQAFRTHSDTTPVRPNDTEVRVVGHTPGSEWTDLALAARAAAAAGDALPGAGLHAVMRVQTVTDGSTATDRISSPTIVPFSSLRADRSAQLRRGQLWMLSVGAAGAAAAAMVISSV